MADRRLEMLTDIRSRIQIEPGRVVVMAARVFCPEPIGAGPREISSVDEHARVPGGRVLPIWLDDTAAVEIVTWNTGEASDLRRYGNLTHAEKQFVRFMGDRAFTRVEVEISHSPCTACATMLASWLKEARQKGRVVTQQPNRREGRRVYLGARVVRDPEIPAILRWGQLYTTPPQATGWPAIKELYDAGWRLAAPGTELPNGSGDVPVVLL